MNPKMEDAGRYTCTVRECNDLSCKGYLEVEPADPEYGIAKGLKDLKGKTKRKVNFKCKGDNPEAKVKWYHNGKEVKPSDTRFLIKNVDGNCSLEIREAEMSDAGEWTCKIDGEFAKEGKDTTSCKLEMSEFQHAFTSQLQGKNVVEGETAVFEIGVEEDDAPAKWYKDGVEIVPDGKRIQIVTEGKKRKLIIKDCKIDDTANITVKVPGDESSAPLKVAHHNGFKTPSNKGDEILESKSSFNVIKGEEAPVMGDCGPVTGTAKKACGMTIPYKVEGEKQSDLEIIVEGPDGKQLKMGKDANMALHGDRLQLDLINPTREKSGKYKVIMKNAQGTCEKFIDINIMDKPTPPKTCKVTDVFRQPDSSLERTGRRRRHPD